MGQTLSSLLYLQVMQVTGTSFFLWVLECYQIMVHQVESLMTEVGRGYHLSVCQLFTPEVF